MGDGSNRFAKGSIQTWTFDPHDGIPAGASQGTRRAPVNPG
jgi:hypothetical protein